MAEQKSRLSFLAQGRRRTLWRRSRTGPFYIRFEHGGKPYLRSLGTTSESTAKEKARQIIDAIFNGDGDAARRLAQRSDYATLRQVCDVYVKKYGHDARRKRTAKGNVNRLGQMVRLGAGLSLEAAKASVLDGKLIRDYEAAEEKRIERDRAGNMVQISELRVRTTIASTLRQARSIFKRSHMSWFDHLLLPNLDKFRDQGVQQPDRPKPRPLDEGVTEEIHAAASKLAIDDAPCYAAHLCFSRLGMRNGEIKAARRTWIVRAIAGTGKLGVIYRPEEEFKPKKKTERWIPIAKSVLDELDRMFKQSPDGDYLVPAENKTERAKIVDRRHAHWAGQWIQNRSKVSYELRRLAGSMVFKKSGNLAYVQQFLGHADLKTTMDWYWYLLDELPALEMDDFAPPAAEQAA